MSGTLAIAAVSAVVKYMFVNALTELTELGLPDAKVSAIAPDKVPGDSVCINVFCFRTSINPGWAQDGLPARDASGDRVARPHLPLDLDFVISAHATKDFHAEILLGLAMQVLHDTPVLPRQLIRDALASPVLQTADTPASTLAAIADADLAEQTELIKFSPEPMSWEALSQLWSALQTQYRPSAIYRASVVLIESRAGARSSLPVRRYGVEAVPIRRPAISAVVAEDGPGTPIVVGKEVRLLGTSLRGEDTRVRVFGAELSGEDLEVSAAEIRFELPAGARAGLAGVQVVHYLSMGTPPRPRRGFESGLAAFVLQPTIRRRNGGYAIDVIPAAGDEPRRLRVEVDPVVDPGQRAALMLNEFAPPDDRPAVALTVDAPPRDAGTPPASQLDFPIPDAPPGEYLVRVRVDGAESSLEYDQAGGYTEPRITLP